LTLDVGLHSASQVAFDFCEGDLFTFHDIETDTAGIFQTTLLNTAGCDSTITLTLTAIDIGQGVILPDTISLELGKTIQLEPLFYDPIFTQFRWLDETGNPFSEAIRISDFLPLNTTTVTLEAMDDFGCSALASTFITVIPNYTIYIPNAFSPNADGINDSFTFYAPMSLERVTSFTVFNRWGGIVFQDDNITAINTYRGWNGDANNEHSEIGVYTYLIQASFLDGTQKLFAGDVTLFR